MRPRSHFVAAIALLALPLYAGNMVFVDRPIVKELPLDIAGSFWVDNPAGSIEIEGVDGSVASITVIRTTIATDREAMAEARARTVISFEGDGHTRFVRTIVPGTPMQKWSSSVKYTVRVPRTVHVRVASKTADPIHVSNIMGNVTVKTFNGTVILDNITGASIVDTVNGKVVYNYKSRPMSHAQITAVSADIDVHLPPESNFDWVAETLRGDFFTDMPVRGRWVGNTFRGSVNAPGGPTLTTATMIGKVVILAGGNLGLARSVRRAPIVPVQAGNPTSRAGYMARVQMPIYRGNYHRLAPSFADINIGQVMGSARVETGGGAIELGTVYGECIAISVGGPLHLGEIMGPLNAHTGAGDILVRAAREGGTIGTEGGIIRVFYTGGPTTLRSGGGDIIVTQAAGPIDAETHSGDITINADPTQRTQRMAAHTVRGNVIINLSPRFGAEIDATVMTTDDDADVIHSDFAGLQIRREQVGSKTRVRATGKINGGGERLDLVTDDGTIHITSQAFNPVAVTK